MRRFVIDARETIDVQYVVEAKDEQDVRRMFERRELSPTVNKRLSESEIIAIAEIPARTP